MAREPLSVAAKFRKKYRRSGVARVGAFAGSRKTSRGRVLIAGRLRCSSLHGHATGGQIVRMVSHASHIPAPPGPPTSVRIPGRRALRKTFAFEAHEAWWNSAAVQAEVQPGCGCCASRANGGTALARHRRPPHRTSVRRATAHPRANAGHFRRYPTASAHAFVERGGRRFCARTPSRKRPTAGRAATREPVVCARQQQSSQVARDARVHD
jgi:hypothetical protein